MRTRIRSFAAVVAALAVCLALAPIAEAAPPAPAKTKTQAALIAAAQSEYDAGNFERAGELFLDIYRQDREAVVGLYNACRAYHLAGKLDKALELYRELLARPDLDPAVKAKVDKYLDDLRLKRAEAKADEAGRAEKAGNYALAARVWADALALAPEKTGWMLRLARAEHLAGNKDAALAGYDKYLALPAEQAPDQADAARWRAELAPKSFADVPVPKDAPPPVVVAAPATPARWPGWTALAGGVALLGGGAGLYLAQGDARAALDQQVADKQAGKVAGIDYQSYQAKRAELNGAYRNAAILAGAGAVAAGVGAWLLVRSPGKVAVVPVGDGFQVAVRF